MRAEVPAVRAARQVQRVGLSCAQSSRENEQQENRRAHLLHPEHGSAESTIGYFGALYSGTVLHGSPNIRLFTTGSSFVLSST